jgi:hypothetical protein
MSVQEDESGRSPVRLRSGSHPDDNGQEYLYTYVYTFICIYIEIDILYILCVCRCVWKYACVCKRNFNFSCCYYYYDLQQLLTCSNDRRDIAVSAGYSANDFIPESQYYKCAKGALMLI